MRGRKEEKQRENSNTETGHQRSVPGQKTRVHGKFVNGIGCKYVFPIGPNRSVGSQCVDALPDTRSDEKLAVLKRKQYHEALDILDKKLIDAKKKTDLIRHDIKQVVYYGRAASLNTTGTSITNLSLVFRRNGPS